MALFEVVTRLDVGTRRHVGQLLEKSPLAWRNDREKIKKVADRTKMPNGEMVRDTRNPMSPWQRVAVDMEDLLIRRHSLSGDIEGNPYDELADQFFVDLAQALLLWHCYRPRFFEVFYSYLGRLSYRQPLIGNHAAMLVGVWILTSRYFTTGHRDDSLSLLGGKDLEASRERKNELETIEALYRKSKEEQNRKAKKKEADPP